MRISTNGLWGSRPTTRRLPPLSSGFGKHRPMDAPRHWSAQSRRSKTPRQSLDCYSRPYTSDPRRTGTTASCCEAGSGSPKIAKFPVKFPCRIGGNRHGDRRCYDRFPVRQRPRLSAWEGRHHITLILFFRPAPRCERGRRFQIPADIGQLRRGCRWLFPGCPRALRPVVRQPTLPCKQLRWDRDRRSHPGRIP